MTTTGIKETISQRLEGLSLESQQRVLGFVESLDKLPEGLTLEQMKRFGGTISEEDAEQMRVAIEEGRLRTDWTCRPLI